jgi:periplasmic divalent cation tolerance protein
MPAEDCLVVCSCPDADTARELAGALVRERHAACVNILPGITSVYAWEGEIETAEEQLMLIKTAAGCYGPLETFIKNHHPYEVPEIIAIPIEQGSSDYLEWIRAWVGRRS